MWKTPDSERQLVGAESLLFRIAIMEVVCRLGDSKECAELGDNDKDYWNTVVFQEMTNEQRLVTIAYIADAMLNKNPPPNLTDIVLEAGVYEIYQSLIENFDDEISDKDLIGDEDSLEQKCLNLYNEYLSSISEETIAENDSELFRVFLSDYLLFDTDFRYVRKIIRRPNEVVNDLREWRRDVDTGDEMSSIIRTPSDSLYRRSKGILREISDKVFHEVYTDELSSIT